MVDEGDMDEKELVFGDSEDDLDDYNDDSSIDSGDEEQFDEEEYYEAGNGMLNGQIRGNRSPPRGISISKGRRRDSGGSSGGSARKSSLLGMTGMSIGSGSFEDSPVKSSPYGWNTISMSPHV